MIQGEHPILTAKKGNNSDLFPDILKLYVPPKSKVADVTYGRGAFWKKVDMELFDLHPSDLKTGTDLKNLPYENSSFDAFVIDPPYAHSSTVELKSPIANSYNLNSVSGRRNILSLYFNGMVEAWRVLNRNAILIVKCQDEVESGQQRWNHVVIMGYAESLGFKCIDLFVLLRKGKPVMRHEHQLHARKNHSYFLIFKKGRGLR